MRFKAKLVYDDFKREIIHALPVNFSVDGKHGYMDPRGISGAKLSVDVNIVSIQSTIIKNMVSCLNKCDLSLAGIATCSLRFWTLKPS